MTPRRTLAVALAAVALLPGCGLGAGPTKKGGGAQLRVTRDFGKVAIVSASVPKIRSSDTVMRLLQGHAKTTTRYGGGFVQSINGLSGGGSGGRRDWFYFVNGTEAPTGAADRHLSPGDVVQWDYRDWHATLHVPAIVGAFPEPFVHGEQGERYPTRIECANGEKACDQVLKRLDDAGVAAGTSVLGAEAKGGILRLEVGTWSQLRHLSELAVFENGPAASGVYARFSGPNQLELLDDHGDVVRIAPPGTGLVAATIPKGQAPLWVITGVDEAGVARAAALLAAGPLRNAYAVAATPGGPVRLPVGSRG
jgi:Domain of unknown function (DUF4430)